MPALGAGPRAAAPQVIWTTVKPDFGRSTRGVVYTDNQDHLAAPVLGAFKMQLLNRAKPSTINAVRTIHSTLTPSAMLPWLHDAEYACFQAAGHAIHPILSGTGTSTAQNVVARGSTLRELTQDLICRAAIEWLRHAARSPQTVMFIPPEIGRSWLRVCP
jgi:hypothetical protein